MIRRFSLASALCIAAAWGGETIEVDLSIERSVGGVSTFDRSKFIVLHSDLVEPDWVGDSEKLHYILEDLDVYLGRDNGSIGWGYDQSWEDPLRPGYVDPEYIKRRGEIERLEKYGKGLSTYHAYEYRVDPIIGAQYSPFWPGSQTNPTELGSGDAWGPTHAKGTGEFMGRFLMEFYRNPGEPASQGPVRPRYIEVMNEPLYHFVTDGDETPESVFEFHRIVAAEIRQHAPNVLVGGYTTAFPYFDRDDFQRWEDRYKLFMDTVGAEMDFLSLHFYDFELHWDKKADRYKGPWNFKGGRIEATLDMVEQYSWLSYGKVKPLYISEYGGRDHKLEAAEWSPERDWTFMKSFSPLMMSLMDRPNTIVKAIPFTLMKAEWAPDIYDWRLFRKGNEGGEKGSKDEWVFTDTIKFFELWSDVKGRRAETNTSDPDLMVDSYVDGNRAFVIVCNLERSPKRFNLDLFGFGDNRLLEVRQKELCAVDGKAMLKENVKKGAPGRTTIGAEATAIFELRFEDDLRTQGKLSEQKYYADTMKQKIKADEALVFRFNEVATLVDGKAILSVGVGREHGKSLKPEVRVNGRELSVSSDFKGDDQLQRESFFGLMEIDVPLDLLRASNEVTVTFPDSGGHIGSATMRLFEFTGEDSTRWVSKSEALSN